MFADMGVCSFVLSAMFACRLSFSLHCGLRIPQVEEGAVCFCCACNLEWRLGYRERTQEIKMMLSRLHSVPLSPFVRSPTRDSNVRVEEVSPKI